MSAGSVSEATDEAIQRVAAIALAARGAHWDAEDTKFSTLVLKAAITSPEGRRALLDVLQPTPEELGGEQVGWQIVGAIDEGPSGILERLEYDKPWRVTDQRPLDFEIAVPVWRFSTSERGG